MNKKKSVGLCLSGGGAKGAAHIGVLKAIEEHDISIDIISGTSAGAIVGSLFAYGYNSDEILQSFISTPIFRPGFYSWKKPGLLNTSAIGKQLGKMIPTDSFESLKIPLHIVATDIENAREVVFDKGPLIKAVLASSSFPGVFSPVMKDEILFADGGILNNFPVEKIRSECDFLIGVDVQNINKIDKRKLKSTFSIMQRVYTISTQFKSRMKYKDCDLVIAPPKLNSYATFNMFKMKKMYQIGYDEASFKLDEYMNSKANIAEL